MNGENRKYQKNNYTLFKKKNNIKIIDHPPPYTTITTLLLELSINVYKNKKCLRKLRYIQTTDYDVSKITILFK